MEPARAAVVRADLHAAWRAWQEVLGLIAEHVRFDDPFWDPTITQVGTSEKTCPLMRVTLRFQALDQTLFGEATLPVPGLEQE